MVGARDEAATLNCEQTNSLYKSIPVAFKETI